MIIKSDYNKFTPFFGSIRTYRKSKLKETEPLAIFFALPQFLLIKIF